MTGDDLLNAIGGIDEKYIRNAAIGPENVQPDVKRETIEGEHSGEEVSEVTNGLTGMKRYRKVACIAIMLVGTALLWISVSYHKRNAKEKPAGENANPVTISPTEKPGENNMMYGEDEIPVAEIRMSSLIGISFYQGAAIITVSGQGKTYEITASDGCLGNYSLGFHKTSTVSVSTDGEDTTDTGTIGVHLYGPGEDEEEYFGPLDADRVLLRIIVREGERISGYALVAFWEKLGPTEKPLFFSGKILKEVSFRKKDGIYPEVTLQEVNARLDQAEKDFATEELFKTSNSILEAETKQVELQPVEKLTLRIEGEIHEEKLDKGLREYEDTGVDIMVAVDFGDVPPAEAKKAFLERYPELDHYRVLGVTGGDRPEPDELLLKIPYVAAKELTKEDAVASVSLLFLPDNETFWGDYVTVVGTIAGKNVYDALKDPGFRFMTDDERAWADVVYSGKLMVAEFQLADDEFARVVVIPKAKYEPMEERLDLEWKESGVANKNEWLIGEEGEAASRRIQAELIQDSLQILYDAGWIVTEENAVNGLPSFRYLCAIVTGRQLRNLKIPEGATYRYEILFDGLWRKELPLREEYYKDTVK